LEKRINKLRRDGVFLNRFDSMPHIFILAECAGKFIATVRRRADDGCSCAAWAAARAVDVSQQVQM
jgi:hypothetical protein